MHLSAVLLTGKPLSSPMLSAPPAGESAYQPHATTSASMACMELFGQSVLQRTIVSLQKTGVCAISVIAPSGCVNFPATKNVGITIAEQPADRWCAVGRALEKHAQLGIDTALIAELGPYVELDIPGALKFHRTKGQSITLLHDNRGPLSHWIVDIARLTSGPDSALPFDEDAAVNSPAPYRVEGYVNRLSGPRDFRRLVVDAFLGHCAITPRGREIKPGVWIDEGARLHKTARLVAPAYVGCDTQVQSAAVITRFSNLERNCNIGEGSLVANASILPHTIIGRGLDVSAAIVDGSEFIQLDRNITLRIQDRNLISNAAPRKLHMPTYLPEYEDSDHHTPDLELEYSQYLSRAAGRLLEVFKGEV